MFTLFHEHFKVRYMPRGLTSWIFFLICLLAVLVLPFIIGLAMQNFWVENNFFFQMPYVYFTGRCALRVTTVRGRELLWTCSELFNSRFIDGTSMEVLPYFSIYEDDEDANNRNDVVTMMLTVPIAEMDVDIYNNSDALPPGSPVDAISEIFFLPEFVYRIKSYLLKLNMTAAPLLQYVRTQPYNGKTTDNTNTTFSSGPLCALTEADLLFHSTERLINSPYVHYTNTYTDSPLELFARQPADLMNLPSFARHYTARNQSVVLREYVVTAGGLDLLSAEDGAGAMQLGEDLALLNDFTWRIRLRIPKAQVFYVPSYAEALKWAWVQYFVIAYLLQWFFWKVRGVIVTLGLIDTTAIFDVKTLK